MTGIGSAKCSSQLRPSQGSVLHESVALITDSSSPVPTRRKHGTCCTRSIRWRSRIAALKNGDKITIDIPNRLLKVELSDKELKERLTQWKPRKPKISKGYLEQDYQPTPSRSPKNHRKIRHHKQDLILSFRKLKKRLYNKWIKEKFRRRWFTRSVSTCPCL